MIVDLDYVYEYGKNIKPTKGKIMIKGINDYKGIKLFEFNILKKENDIKDFKIINNQPVAQCIYGKPSFVYYSDKACTNKLSTIPTDVGQYFVKAISMETDCYHGIQSDPISLNIKAIK